MRKLYAHGIFDETHDLKKVQEALNHRNLSTTLAYLDIDPANLVLQDFNGGAL
jgi:site-specific recombinase XerC